MKTSNEVTSAKTKKIKFVIKDDFCNQKVVVNRNKQTIKIKAGEGYSEAWKGSTLCQLKDTGNEVIIDLEYMDQIILDYSQLDYLRKVLNVWEDYFNVLGKNYVNTQENYYE